MARPRIESRIRVSRLHLGENPLPMAHLRKRLEPTHTSQRAHLRPVRWRALGPRR